MSGFSKFLAGFFVFCLLSIFCIMNHKHQFVFPDAGAIQTKLSAAGLNGINVNSHEGTVTLTGEVPSNDAKAQAETEALAMEGVDLVNNQLTVNDGPGEFAARFFKKGDGVVLRGELPDQATKDGVVAQATTLWGDGKVTDELTVKGVNASPDLLPSISGMLPNVKELQGGKLVVNREEFHLYGHSPDAGLSRTLSDQHTPGLPKDTALGVHIGQPWTNDSLMGIARTNGDNVVLSGVVPDWGTHDKYLEMAHKEWGPEKVTNRMQVADLESNPKMLDSFGKLLPALKDVDGGQLTASPTDTTFAAYVDPESDDAKSMTEKLKGLWPDVNFDFGLRYANGDCKKAVDAVLAKGKIQFETDSDAIKVESDPLLRQLASVIRKCPEGEIEIQGHTDADGDDAYNLDLSQRRAGAVLVRLQSLGMPPSRAVAKGYGETAPIADNGTEEGKAKNRRIEFNLKGSGN